MKEASGEASMTGITIALIAIVAVIATPIITNTVQSTKKSSACQADGGTWWKGACYAQCTRNSDGSIKECANSYTPST